MKDLFLHINKLRSNSVQNNINFPRPESAKNLKEAIKEKIEKKNKERSLKERQSEAINTILNSLINTNKIEEKDENKKSKFDKAELKTEKSENKPNYNYICFQKLKES